MAAIEQLVRAIAANRRTLLPLRAVAPELRRAVKNPWRTHGVRVDRAAVLSDLPVRDVRSVRLDPATDLTITTDGRIGRGRLVDDALVFTHSRKVTARVEGPRDRLTLLADVLAGRRLLPEDLLSARMPANLELFAAHVVGRQDEIDELLDAGRRLVEAVERLVCGLYGLSDELMALVIESAVTRSGTVADRDE